MKTRRRQTWRAVLAVAAVSIWAQAPCLDAQRVADEYQLKAAFVFHFPQFVEWPPSALDGRPTIDLCVLSPSPFGRALDDLVSGESLDGHRMAVRTVEAGGPLDACHLLYVPEAAQGRQALMRRVAPLPILTVSDVPDFLDGGGIIQLRVVDHKVRFDINATAAKRAGLSLSSQLLRLATKVRGGEQ